MSQVTDELNSLLGGLTQLDWDDASDVKYYPGSSEIESFWIESYNQVALMASDDPHLLDDLTASVDFGWILNSHDGGKYWQVSSDIQLLRVVELGVKRDIAVTDALQGSGPFQKRKAKVVDTEEEWSMANDVDSLYACDVSTPVAHIGGDYIQIHDGTTDSLPYAKFIWGYKPGEITYAGNWASSGASATYVPPEWAKNPTLNLIAAKICRWAASVWMANLPDDLGTKAYMVDSGTGHAGSSFDTVADLGTLASVVEAAINTGGITGDAGAPIDMTMSDTVESLDVWQNASDTGVFDYIDAQEDIELAGAKLQAIGGKLNHITQEYNNYMTHNTAATNEYNINLQKKLTMYQTTIADVNARVSALMARAEILDAEAGKTLSLLMGTSVVAPVKGASAQLSEGKNK